MIKCSIGICVYNEEKNIAKLLDNLLSQKLHRVRIVEILVISSGSTDKTTNISKLFSKKNRTIKIITQKERKGKASAVNLFIQKAKSEILVLLSGDLQLPVNTIENLVRPFSHRNIGMTGAHPVPINNIRDGLSGFAAHLLWKLHHYVSLDKPKMGEAIAFRKVFKRIPIFSSVDEANIEPLISGQGYELKYITNAKVFNKAPINVREFIIQRRRIYSGHLALIDKQGYRVSTVNIFPILRAILLYVSNHPIPSHLIKIPAIIVLEAYCRFLGWWDYSITKKNHSIWEMVESTKNISE